MGLLGSTLVMYFLAGVAVAGAVYLSDGERRLWERGFRVLTAIPFWPASVVVRPFRPAVSFTPTSGPRRAPRRQRCRACTGV